MAGLGIRVRRDMALGEQGIVGRRALLAMLAFGPLVMRPASAAPSEPEAFIAALGSVQPLAARPAVERGGR